MNSHGSRSMTVAAPLAGFAGLPPEGPAWFNAAMADEPQRTTVTVQGAPIEVLAWGDVGDPGLLLLHGNGAHADWFSFIAPLLKTGRRVVALSFSGMGGSGWRTQYGVSQWADEALAVAEATGLFEAAVPPTVAAHSFGGFPLMNLAARHGQRLARAVIMDTPVRPPGSREGRRFRPPNLRSAKVYASLDAALMRFRYLPPQASTAPFIADVIARRGLKPVIGPDGGPGWVWRFDPFMFRHFDFGRPQRDLAQARCPVTLVRGGRSGLVTPALMALQLAAAPAGTEALTLDDADHHLMVDQPLAFAALLDRLAAAR